MLCGQCGHLMSFMFSSQAVNHRVTGHVSRAIGHEKWRWHSHIWQLAPWTRFPGVWCWAFRCLQSEHFAGSSGSLMFSSLSAIGLAVRWPAVRAHIFVGWQPEQGSYQVPRGLLASVIPFAQSGILLVKVGALRRAIIMRATKDDVAVDTAGRFPVVHVVLSRPPIYLRVRCRWRRGWQTRNRHRRHWLRPELPIIGHADLVQQFLVAAVGLSRCSADDREGE